MMSTFTQHVQASLELAEQYPTRWLRDRHPHTYARVQQPSVQRVLLLTAVCVALLLDNMLYMVIVPIIPDYLRHIGAWHTHRLPTTHNHLNVTFPAAASSTSAASHLQHMPIVLPSAANRTYQRSAHESTSRPLLAASTPAHLWNEKTPVKRPLTTAGGRLVYEGEDGAIGVLFASKALVQLLVNPFSGALIDRVGAGRPMLFGLLVMFVSTAVFAAGSSYSVLLLARSLQGVGSAFADTGGFALLAARFSQPQEREQALGLALSFVSFGCLFAPPFGALLYEFFGKELPFVVLSLVCLMDGVLVLAVLHPNPDSSWTAKSGDTKPSSQTEASRILNDHKSNGKSTDSHRFVNGTATNGSLNQTLYLHQLHAKADSEPMPANAKQTPILNEFLLQQSRERAARLKHESFSTNANRHSDYVVQTAFPVELANDWNARIELSESSTGNSSESSPNQPNSTSQYVPGTPKRTIQSAQSTGLNLEPHHPEDDTTATTTTASTAAIVHKSATPIYVLFRDPQIAVCAGALVMANVSLAFLEPTLSIWMVDHLRAKEWQLGLVWLPAFFPYVFGVYFTVRLNHKYPQYKYLVAIGGLLLTGISCLCLPAVSSYAQLMLPIGSLCFGVAIIDSAVFPALGYIVDTRYVSVYGSVYAIADISYSLAYAFGPIVAGAIVSSLDFVWLNWIIALLTLGYCPLLLRLRSVQRYERLDSPELEWK